MAKKSLTTKIEANRKRASGTAAGYALELRIDLAQLVFRILKVGEATPEELSETTGMTLRKIKTILAADFNVSTEDMGMIGWALGVNFHLRGERLV